MNWLLVLIVLNAQNNFNLKVVERFETRAQCIKVMHAYKLALPYLGCVNSLEEVKPSRFTEEKDKLLKAEALSRPQESEKVNNK